MGASTPAGIITAVASVITALGGLILAFGVLLPLLRTTRATHEIVNQRYTNLENYQFALVRALEDNGIPIPVDQSAGASRQPDR